MSLHYILVLFSVTFWFSFISLCMFDDILKEKLEITMYIIIVSKKYQIIQQYKKQPKKSNKFFLMTSSFL